MNDNENMNFFRLPPSSLNEYEALGAYHTEMRLSRTWLPRYFRRFHIALTVLKEHLPSNAFIADIGGGEGVFIEALERAGFGNAVGVDYFAPFSHKKMMRGDICSLPLSGERFDAITCFDVLEHIPLDRQSRAASELSRILKPGGIAIISVPNMAHLRSRLQFLVKGRPWRNSLIKHPGELTLGEHIEVLTQARLECWDRAGLHLTMSYNPNPSLPFGRFMSRMMFSTLAPTGLCWTVVLLCCKPPRPKWLQRSPRPLKRALRSYCPVEQDPTGD